MTKKNALELFGGSEELGKRIAAAIRARNPNHIIAISNTPHLEIEKISRQQLLDLFLHLEIGIDEAMGSIEFSSKEEKDVWQKKAEESLIHSHKTTSTNHRQQAQKLNFRNN